MFLVSVAGNDEIINRYFQISCCSKLNKKCFGPTQLCISYCDSSEAEMPTSRERGRQKLCTGDCIKVVQLFLNGFVSKPVIVNRWLGTQKWIIEPTVLRNQRPSP